MRDEFRAVFGWIGGVLERPLTDTFDAHSAEHAILAQLKEGWGKRDMVELLKGSRPNTATGPEDGGEIPGA